MDSICSYLCFIAIFISGFFIIHLAGNSYTVSVPLEALDFRAAVLSNQALNSIGALDGTGV